MFRSAQVTTETSRFAQSLEFEKDNEQLRRLNLGQMLETMQTEHALMEKQFMRLATAHTQAEEVICFFASAPKKRIAYTQNPA
jgi:replicative DNA helicase